MSIIINLRFIYSNCYNFINKMLRLQKIRVCSQQPLFSTRNRKHLRINVQNYSKSTAKIARVKNQYQISWDESLPLPLIYDKQYSFQLYDNYQLGSNPEQQVIILKGKIIFDSLKQDTAEWDVYTKDNIRIATLSANIITKASSVARDLMKSAQKLTTQSPIIEKQKKVLRILSLLAKLPNIYIKKAYFYIEIGSNIIKTPELKSKHNELVFIQARQVQLEQYDTQAQIKIFHANNKQEDEPVAQTHLQLTNHKNTKRLTLMKDGFEIGQLYIEYRVVDKSQISTTNYVQNINKTKDKKYSTIQVNQLQQQQIKQRGRYSSLMSKSIDYSNLSSKLQDFGIKNSRLSKPSGLNSSMVSTTSMQRRNSVVHKNSNIVFPKQRRFQIYQDKQNQNISYLLQRNFQFKYTNLGSKYKGAALGYGDKIDFAQHKKYSPGVGDYKLPSIWDRY